MRPAQHVCAVQCCLRIVQHLVGLRVAGRADGNADARRQPDLTSAERERIEHLTQDAIGDDLGVADVFQAVEQDREVVAVQSRNEIVVAQAGHRVRECAGTFPDVGRRP